MFTLRDFMYLDERTVKRYISSIEKGLVQEVMEKDINAQPSWDFEVSLGKLQELLVATGVPAPEVGIKRTGKSDTLSVQINKKPTIDSQFDQLVNYLEPVTQSLDKINAKNWSRIKKGQFISYQSKFTLPKGYQNAQILNIGADFYEMAKNMGITEEFEGKERFEKIMAQSEGYREEAASKKFTNIRSIPINSPNESKYYFVSKINHDNLVEHSLEDITYGTATVLARIDHIIGGNETYTIFDSSLKGIDRIMNREERRKQKNDLFEVATRPAIVIRPIAIYKE